MAIKVNGGGGTERVEFGGLRRQCGGKKCGDQQTNDAVRQLLQDEGDENVIGIVGRRDGMVGGQFFIRGGANFFTLLVRR